MKPYLLGTLTVSISAKVQEATDRREVHVARLGYVMGRALVAVAKHSQADTTHSREELHKL